MLQRLHLRGESGSEHPGGRGKVGKCAQGRRKFIPATPLPGVACERPAGGLLGGTEGREPWLGDHVTQVAPPCAEAGKVDFWDRSWPAEAPGSVFLCVWEVTSDSRGGGQTACRRPRRPVRTGACLPRAGRCWIRVSSPVRPGADVWWGVSLRLDRQGVGSGSRHGAHEALSSLDKGPEFQSVPFPNLGRQAVRAEKVTSLDHGAWAGASPCPHLSSNRNRYSRPDPKEPPDQGMRRSCLSCLVGPGSPACSP